MNRNHKSQRSSIIFSVTLSSVSSALVYCDLWPYGTVPSGVASFLNKMDRINVSAVGYKALKHMITYLKIVLWAVHKWRHTLGGSCIFCLQHETICIKSWHEGVIKYTSKWQHLRMTLESYLAHTMLLFYNLNAILIIRNGYPYERFVYIRLYGLFRSKSLKNKG